MAAKRRSWLSLLLVAVLLGVRAVPVDPEGRGDESESEALEAENEQLKQRLKALETKLKEEQQWTYVVVKGYISGAENVFMETMEVDQAKQYCNANPQCQGFTFNGPDERPEDEVTVTFKAGSDVEADVNFVSYVKHATVFGAVGDAAMQLEGSSIVAESITYEAICLVVAFSLALVFCCRRRFSGEGRHAARGLTS